MKLQLLLLLFWFVSGSIPASGQARIQTISPSQGPIDGGTVVTITGSGFTGTSLTLDGAAITSVSASDTQITFRTQAHDNGIGSVKLSGNGPNAYAEFLYLPPPLQTLPPGYITTVMGIGAFRGDGRQATNAIVDSSPGYIAAGSDGTLYISESNEDAIRQVRNDGVIERYAGTGYAGTSGDGGPAAEAQLFHPRGLAIDPAGDLFVANQLVLNSIRKIDRKTGIITTIAGGPTASRSGDGGPAAATQLNGPQNVAFDGAGNLYILECGGASVCDHPRVRKVDTNGIITTIAGTGVVGFSGDGGPALAATFDIGVADDGGLAADVAGNVYVADTRNGSVRKIDGQTHIITTLVAAAGVRAVATDSSGNVYVGIGNNEPRSVGILKLASNGQILQSWGKGYGFSDDGTAAVNAQLCQVYGIALDPRGNILFAEDCSSRIRRINLGTGLLETVAGMGPHIIGETGPALATMLDTGTDLLFLPTGELLTAEGSNYRIRKVDQQGNVSVFAGNGFLSYPTAQDGVPALQASIYPVGLGLTPNGDILAVEGPAVGTFRIDGSGIIHALTKNQSGFAGDGGPASLALLDEPWNVTADSAGNLYIADTNNNRIRRIDGQTGVITTVAGSGPVNGNENYGAGSYCGDGGPATQACLNTPYGIAVAPDGTMYIGENSYKPNDARIRRVDPNGMITTFFSGGGQRLRLGPGGNLFMVPYRIEPNGHAFQFAFNNPSQSGLGDGGPASLTSYRGGLQSVGIAVDAEGNLFFADPSNRRIRAIRYGAVIAEPGSTVAATGGTPQTTMAGRTFPIALQITLSSPAGTLENGIRVDFAAPASGPSCVFPGGGATYFTLTDSNGHATAVCTANSRTGAYAVTATPLNLGKSATFSLTNMAPPPPQVAANGIVNGASFDAAKPGRIAPGALISIFGTGLATQSGVQVAQTLPVPTQLGGTQVLINGIAAPIFAVAGNPTSDQINAQVPFEIAGATTGSLVVRVTGQPDSAPAPVTIVPASPAIFTVSADGQGPGVIQHGANFTPVNSASPAKPGEAVVIYCAGLGVTSPPTADGDHGSTTEPFNRTVETPVVTIGGKVGQVLFSGVAPCCAALYQINVLVPADAPAGNQPVSIVMPASNVASRSGVTINIQP
jgi:uncharacterized protein (TIGR03437 family)